QEIRQDRAWLSETSVNRNTVLQHIKERIQQNKWDLTPVINGTGAVIHTNLGRSVFSREILEEVIEIATSYTNLEFSLETGKRGPRVDSVIRLLRSLTGAEEAVIVNNNAAAVVLSLAALAPQKEVVISRGELVEIGGSFRIPDIIETSGAKLKEVGTTNRTKLKDYQAAISEETSVLLKVHTSNYQIVGFTESTQTADLAKLAKKEGLILIEDIGSGVLTEFSYPQLNSDPLIPQVIKDGADVVTISGDKLLGGPQAGIIIGKKQYLDQIKSHPLYRAFRCDKLTMLLLEKTLLTYLRNEQRQKIPTQRMLNEGSSIVKTRAEKILEVLPPEAFTIIPCESTPGGGSLPGKKIPSWGILVKKEGKTEQQILDFLRSCNPPLIARIQEGQVLIDCRTVLPHQISLLQNILQEFI
ncbi:MAG: L-seryl-tRNA(Sec) selenium transferase, partial [SAR324 cluster bacterium]